MDIRSFPKQEFQVTIAIHWQRHHHLMLPNWSQIIIAKSIFNILIPRFHFCGNTFKILRTFNVLNWCNGEIRTHNQIIKISDNDGPSITCQNQTPFKIYTSRHKCGGDFTVPEPSVQDCNTTSWTVTYKLQDKYGVFDDNAPFVNDNVVVFGVQQQLWTFL